MSGVRLVEGVCKSATMKPSSVLPMLPDQTARSVAERWARIMVLDDDAGGHILFVRIHADHHNGERAISLGSEVEPDSLATRLSENLIDHFARKVSATFGQRR